MTMVSLNIVIRKAKTELYISLKYVYIVNMTMLGYVIERLHLNKSNIFFKNVEEHFPVLIW